MHLAPYGRFADLTLDFGERGSGGDVTIIYGPNEAGKSTIFAAWLDLLFGIHPQTGYSFRYPRRDLRIGAEIEADGEVQTLWRDGKRTGSLTDADGRSVPDHRIAALLHGLDRSAYRSRFSLDEMVLREGGREILEAKGDLGQVLYAGTSGLSGLSSALDDISVTIEGIYRKGASTTELAKGKKRLAELESSLHEAQLDPRRHASLQKAVDDAQTAVQAMEREREAAHAALGLNDAALRRKGLLEALKQQCDALSAFPKGPDLPSDAKTRFAEVRTTIRNTRTTLGEAEDAKQDAKKRLGDTEPDPEGLALIPNIEALEAARFRNDEPLATRADAAWLDLTNRKEDLAGLERECARLAAEIGGAGAKADKVAAPLGRLAEIEDALRDRRAALTSVRTAERELERACKAFGEPIPPPEGIEALEIARRDWEDARRTDPEALSVRARSAKSIAARTAAGLPDVWRAIVSAPEGLPTEASLSLIAQNHETARRNLDHTETEVNEAQDQSAEAENRRDSLAARDDHVSDERLAEQRHARNLAWRRHCEALTPGTADEFETALLADDRAREAHVQGVELRERVRSGGEEIVRTSAVLDRRKVTADKARRALEAAAQATTEAARRLGLSDNAPPDSLVPRRSALHEALDSALEAEGTEEDARAAKAQLEKAEHALRALIASAAEDAPALAEAVAKRVEALRAKQRAHDIYTKSKKDAERRETELEDAKAALTDADAILTDALNGLWCATLAADVLDARFDIVRDLASTISQRDELRRRVREMQEALDTFEDLAEPLRKRLGSSEAPAALLKSANSRVAKAREVQSALDRANEDLRKAETARKRAQSIIDETEAERAQLLSGQGDDPNAVDADALVARLLERDRLRGDAAKLEHEIGRLESEYNPAALDEEGACLAPGRDAVLKDILEDAENRHHGTIEQRALARDALQSALRAEGGGAFAQERAILVAELRESLRDAATRLIGLRAARAALDQLRRERRGSMLEHCETAFIRMTGGEWSGLSTRPEGTGERLVGLRGDDAVSADGMSQGTRGQLYLSLRLAGYTLFCNEAGPLPFITDDVLETFDDSRAAAALDLTAQLGTRGQAVLLTHHSHLVEMARDRIPAAHIVSLEPNH